MKKLILFPGMLVISLFCIYAAPNDETPIPDKKKYTTQRLPAGVDLSIDGKLDDAAWKEVPWGSEFKQRFPNNGEDPSMNTQFKIIYDDKYLYVGFRCHDTEPHKIVKRLGRRDGFEGDWVEINIDSYHDLQNAFSFTITAAGVKGDEFVSQDGNNWDASWNPIWIARSHVDEVGWSAEMKIPFNQLRFSQADELTWGIQINRKFFRKDEQSNWQFVPNGTAGWVSQFGELHGIKAIKPKRQIELQPYGLAKVSLYEAEDGNPFRDGSDIELTGGLDAKIGITNDLTLDATINPDFGQVEADPAAIALDGFQIFFREQRPFFVENSSIFDYGLSRSQAGNTFGNDNLFYSRRIGRRPSHFPNVGANEYNNQPNNTTILGAAKLSGKTQKGLSIGILETVTGKEFAEIDQDGERRDELVEPLTNYFVTRLKQDFNERNSTIGLILTSTVRNIEGELDFLHKSATTAGVDLLHQWKDRSWYVSGNAVISHVEGSKRALLRTQRSIRHLFDRVDAEYLSVDTNRTGFTGSGGNFKIGKLGGDLIFESGFTWRSPGLELNDVGFQRLSDDLRHFTWAGYRWREPFSIFRQTGINYNHWLAFDYGGQLKSLAFNVNTNSTFKNNWGLGFGTNISPLQYSITKLRGGPRVKNLPSYGGWIYVNTDNTKKVSFNTEFNLEKAQENSSRYFGMSYFLRIQPINSINISFGPNYSIWRNQLQYVGQSSFDGDERYLVGNIEQKTLGMSVRLNYTINPDLTLQFYGEPFISTGNYDKFRYVSDPLSGTIDGQAELLTANQISFMDDEGYYSVDENADGLEDYSFNDPDFTFVQYRSNFVLRWEYVPGSELYFVWTQNNNNFEKGDGSLLNILNDQLIGNPSEHIFLVKLTYRWSL